MKALVRWHGGMAFSGAGDVSGRTVEMDTSAEVGGGNNAARPIELLLIGLAGCTGMDMITILRKMRKEVTALEIAVEADQETDFPRKIGRMRITYRIAGPDLDEGSVRRAMELSEQKYCSVGATLRGAVRIESKLELQHQPGE